MKSVNELGISPMPWHVTEHQDKESGESYFNVNSSRSSYVADGTTMPDKRLIAAAPELYECLREATLIEQCHDAETHCEFCPTSSKCRAYRWKKVLAKAAGEETK